MDLKQHKFKNDKRFVFDEELLQEAKNRGFYCKDTPYNTLFSNLFYKGGKFKFKADLDETFKKEAWGYCKSLIGQFSPSHEDKEAVCALLMSELLEPELDESGN